MVAAWAPATGTTAREHARTRTAVRLMAPPYLCAQRRSPRRALPAHREVLPRQASGQADIHARMGGSALPASKTSMCPRPGKTVVATSIWDRASASAKSVVCTRGTFAHLHRRARAGPAGLSPPRCRRRATPSGSRDATPRAPRSGRHPSTTTARAKGVRVVHAGQADQPIDRDGWVGAVGSEGVTRRATREARWPPAEWPRTTT